MTHLYLIRHGEARGSVEGFVGDGGLSPLGVTQAERLRDRLTATQEIDADIVISSTFPRATQTAKIIAPAFRVPLLFDDDLQELRPGDAEGMRIEDFHHAFGRPNYEKAPFRQIAPEGESWGQFMLRVATALERIIHEHEGKTIVLICHGGVIDGSFILFFRLNAWMPPPTRFATCNTSITHWGSPSSGQWQLLGFNDWIHLRDIDVPVRLPWEQFAPRSRTNGAQKNVVAQANT